MKKCEKKNFIDTEQTTLYKNHNSLIYYSQDGQDEFIHKNFFLEKKKGIFVEIGAYDGINISNTYFFEKNLEWNGLCIEPIPNLYNQLIKNRKCFCSNSCVSDTEGIKEFLLLKGGNQWTEYCSGLIQYYHPKHQSFINKELSEFGGEKNIINVRCQPLKNLLNEHKIQKIDYLSIDVEGAELSILKSIDFSKIYIDVISVENLFMKKKIQFFLESHGYQYIKKVGYDEIYKLKFSSN